MRYRADGVIRTLTQAWNMPVTVCGGVNTAERKHCMTSYAATAEIMEVLGSCATSHAISYAALYHSAQDCSGRPGPTSMFGTYANTLSVCNMSCRDTMQSYCQNTLFTTFHLKACE